MKIGQRIKQERINQGLTLEKLAEKLDISKQSVQKIESGRTLKSRYLSDVCSILGISLNNDHAAPLYSVNNTKSNDNIISVLLNRISSLENRLSEVEQSLYTR